MGLDTPAWLWLLLPWAALVVLTLRAYRPISNVPFIDLWPREEPRDDRRRAWRPPPLPILLLLIALLGGILALSGPWLRSGHPRIGRLTVVLDRGATMLAGGRFEQAAGAFRQAVAPLLDPEAVITVVDPLQQDVLVGPAGLADALSRPATAMDLRARVSGAVDRAKSHGGAVVLISDWPEEPDGVIVARPAVRVQNVGIVRAAANGGQCRLTLRNDSDMTHAAVAIIAGDTRLEQELELPTRAGEHDYEISCPDAMPMRVELRAADDLADDNTWWLLPDRVAARQRASGSAPDWLSRFASSYASATRVSELSREVVITAEQVQAPRTVCVSSGERRIVIPTGRPVVDHPLLRHVTLPREVLGGQPLPAGEWQVILDVDGTPLLAVAEAQRSVWIGFRPAGEIMPEYLILLSNAVDFGCGVQCSAGEPVPLDSEWRAIEGPGQQSPIPGARPGLYQSGDRYLAINLRSPRFESFTASRPIAEQLQSAAERNSRVALAPRIWLAVCAIVLTAAMAIALKQRRPRR